MFYTDEKLMLLERYLRDHDFERMAVADYLSISNRHLSRLLKRWEEDGLIIYRSGRGRGKNSLVIFLIDAEDRFVKLCLCHMDRLRMDDVLYLLSLPLKTESRDMIRNGIENKLFSQAVEMMNKPSGFTLMEYIKYVPEDIFDFDKTHGVNDKIIFNTMDRLFQMDENGNLVNSIAAHWEWEDDTLHIYLKKRIRYYNGDTLNAKDVVVALEDMLRERSTPNIRNNINYVSALSEFHVIIETYRRSDLILLKLASLNSSLYRNRNGVTYTTGAFFISEKTDSSLILKRNPHHFFSPGDISSVHLVSNLGEYMKYIEKQDIKSIVIEGPSKLNFMLKNPDSQRMDKEQRRYIDQVVGKYVNHYDFDWGMYYQTYSRYSRLLTGADAAPSYFEQPVRIICVGSFFQEFEHLADYLRNNGVPVIATHVLENDFLKSDESMLDVDIAIVAENISGMYKYFHMLKQSKFRKWFMETRAAKNLLQVYRLKHHEYWNIVERQFESFLVEKGYAMPLNYTVQTMNVPTYFKNVRNNIYGVIDYNRIVADDDGVMEA